MHFGHGVMGFVCWDVVERSKREDSKFCDALSKKPRKGQVEVGEGG